MIYCSKCGRKLGVNDVYCPACGERNTGSTVKGGNAGSGRQSPPAASPGAGSNPGARSVQQETQAADPNAVQYVYVSKKTGKITHNPHVKTKSEGCLQFLAIAFGAVAMVFFMVAGSAILTGYLSEGSSDTESRWTEPEVSSREEVTSAPVSSETRPSQPVSSEEVSSAPSIPEELTAAYMQKKIKGKWKTDVPYKTMNLPGTFEFDGKGRCKCSVKAFLFTKKFEGTYLIKDGGECRVTLDGIGEYTDDDTMVGDLRFVTEDKIEFTVEDTVWKLTRAD